MKQAFLYITATALDKVRVREGNRPSFLNFSFKNKKETNFFQLFKWENCKKKFCVKSGVYNFKCNLKVAFGLIFLSALLLCFSLFL